MAHRGRTTPTGADQMSLDFLWGADDSPDDDRAEHDLDGGRADSAPEHEQQAAGTPGGRDTDRRDP